MRAYGTHKRETNDNTKTKTADKTEIAALKDDFRVTKTTIASFHSDLRPDSHRCVNVWNVNNNGKRMNTTEKKWFSERYETNERKKIFAAKK